MGRTDITCLKYSPTAQTQGAQKKSLKRIYGLMADCYIVIKEVVLGGQELGRYTYEGTKV